MADFAAKLSLQCLEVGQHGCASFERFDDEVVLYAFLHECLDAAFCRADLMGECFHSADVEAADDQEYREQKYNYECQRAVH